MNRERLSQMVTMLRGLPEDGPVGFNLEHWVDDEAPCGTAACAIGHACLSPTFNEQGLMLHRATIYPGPKFKKHTGWAAVEEFFGLSEPSAKHLFLGDNYPDGDITPPADVADRIESFLANAEV